MLPRRILDGTTSHDGRELELLQQGDDFYIQIDRWDLMSSRAHHSEEEMAALALAALGGGREPRCLIGGLGMGFTLRACLEALDAYAGGSVIIAEAFEAMVEWNRGPLGHLASHPLDDPRVQVEIGDVFDRLDPQGTPFDIILLDVDNGPDALSFKSNERLYRDRGLNRIRRCLSPGGVLAIWSAADDAGFESRLSKIGFQVDIKHVRSRPGNKGSRHTIFLAKTRSTSRARPSRADKR